MARSLRFYGDGISFRVVFGQSFYFRIFPGGARIAKPRWMLARGILGSGWTRGVSFRPFLNSFGCWWLLVPYSLPGSPVINNLCKWLLWCLARVGGFNQCASPHTFVIFSRQSLGLPRWLSNKESTCECKETWV